MGTESRGDLKILAIVLGVAALFLVIAFTFGASLINGLTFALGPGLGLKEAAKWSFGVTVALFIVFAIAAGDGLIGELQYMLLGFFAFFVIITLLIAWAF
jgi:hypothetical protein